MTTIWLNVLCYLDNDDDYDNEDDDQDGGDDDDDDDDDDFGLMFRPDINLSIVNWNYSTIIS